MIDPWKLHEVLRENEGLTYEEVLPLTSAETDIRQRVGEIRLGLDQIEADLATGSQFHTGGLGGALDLERAMGTRDSLLRVLRHNGVDLSMIVDDRR